MEKNKEWLKDKIKDEERDLKYVYDNYVPYEKVLIADDVYDLINQLDETKITDEIRYGYEMDKPFIPNNKNILLLEKHLNITLHEWQKEFLKGSTYINKNRASGKTYIFVLSYTLGLMEIYTLQKLETDLSNAIRKVDTLHYIQKINKDIIKKLKDVEERNFTLYEL